MGYVIAGIAGIFALYLLLWLTVLTVMWIVVPLWIVICLVGLAAGVGLVFVRFATTYAGKGPRTTTPDDVVAGQAGLPKLRGDNPFGRDWAWPTYVSSQSWVDLRAALATILKELRSRWEAVAKYPGRSGDTWMWGPVVVFAFPVLAAVSAGAAATATALAVMVLVTLFGCWAVWTVPTGLLRGGDLLIRRVRRARGSCATCYHVTSLPAFPCGGCGKVHRDVRPGRLGAVRRRCGCGAALPTTVLLAAATLTAQCPRCDRPLREGAAVITDVRLPVFGPVSAGKTRLVYAGLLALRDDLASAGATLDFVDDDSRTLFDDARKVVSSNSATAKTPAGELPHAVTVRLTKARKRALLHLFDAAGEFYADREDNGDLEFLDHAQGLVFVIDPFSVSWVVDQLGDAGAVNLARANPATENPEGVYQVTTRRLRDYGVDTRSRSLALTVVKADLLSGLTPGDGLRSGDVRQWLVDAGLDNLVLSAERDFGEVRYFVVASLPVATAGEEMSPGKPFEWLLSRAGIAMLPEEPVRRHQEEST